MKIEKTALITANIGENFKLKVKKAAEENECSESTIVRVALKKLFASNKGDEIIR